MEPRGTYTSLSKAHPGSLREAHRQRMPSSWSKLNLRHSQAVLLVLVRSKASSSELAAHRLHFSRLWEVQVQGEPQLCAGSSTFFFFKFSVCWVTVWGPNIMGRLNWVKNKSFMREKKAGPRICLQEDLWFRERVT